eukprot:TRINITY_DN5538_c0_g3_i1.p1 TRINITY_DN5538_c0_g3~~TRINITY_DN5538_c0_g3_i1.p1  ORF type:complete len:291 (+),score=45.84 TRINITY_DN5538_c0_g3_i1:115-987(+)
MLDTWKRHIANKGWMWEQGIRWIESQCQGPAKIWIQSDAIQPFLLRLEDAGPENLVQEEASEVGLEEDTGFTPNPSPPPLKIGKHGFQTAFLQEFVRSWMIEQWEEELYTCRQGTDLVVAFAARVYNLASACGVHGQTIAEKQLMHLFYKGLNPLTKQQAYYLCHTKKYHQLMELAKDLMNQEPIFSNSLPPTTQIRTQTDETLPQLKPRIAAYFQPAVTTTLESVDLLTITSSERKVAQLEPGSIVLKEGTGLKSETNVQYQRDDNNYSRCNRLDNIAQKVEKRRRSYK